jgi:hypothetical protein
MNYHKVDPIQFVPSILRGNIIVWKVPSSIGAQFLPSFYHILTLCVPIKQLHSQCQKKMVQYFTLLN